MAQKVVIIPGIGEVRLQKRRGNRGLRISIGTTGAVKVTLPMWAPYELAREFALSKLDWIEKHRPSYSLITAGTRVGKAHQVQFMTSKSATQTSVTIKNNEIRVFLPQNDTWQHEAAQTAARRGAIRALKKEAEQLLPGRLADIAARFNFNYSGLRIKRLSTRWGSCDNQKVITLNCYLMQLSWPLIDYVLTHELMHTRIMAHGPRFWTALKQHVPDLDQKRKEIRAYRPDLIL